MATPTAYFGWELPAQSVGSWSTAVDSIFRAVDEAVSSVEQFRHQLRYTLALSFYPSATFSMYHSYDDRSFTVISAAPYGAAIGSFSTAFSGTNVMIDLRMTITPSLSTSQSAHQYLRAVINPGSILVPETGSGWVWGSANFFMRSQRFIGFWGVASLGPGDYSVGVDQLTLGVSSVAFVMEAWGGWITLGAFEVPRE
jgi:hypothetical protein